MTSTTVVQETTTTLVLGHERPRRVRRRRWGLFSVMVVITAIVLVPVFSVLLLSISPAIGSNQGPVTFANFVRVFTETGVASWLGNSLAVSVSTVVVVIIVAAPAGYVLSRARNRLVSAYSLTLFVIQSLPVITAIIPLFILFANLGLVDSLVGVAILYVSVSLAVAIWMLAAYFDSIPVTLEEAAWVDGASLLGGFTRIVLRNSLPGILSTAIFSFILSWNDYLIAVIFLRSQSNYTLPVGLQTFFQQNQTDWGLVMAVAVVMMVPPVLLFAALNRYFSVGGIGGSLAGR